MVGNIDVLCMGLGANIGEGMRMAGGGNNTGMGKVAVKRIDGLEFVALQVQLRPVILILAEFHPKFLLNLRINSLHIW